MKAPYSYCVERDDEKKKKKKEKKRAPGNENKV